MRGKKKAADPENRRRPRRLRLAAKKFSAGLLMNPGA